MPAKEPTWTVERIERLKDRFAAGLTCRQIAADIGVSRNAVIGKLSRLNLTREQSGDARPPARKKDAAERTRREPKPRQQYRLLQALYDGSQPVVTGDDPIPSAHSCSLMELNEARCRWPITPAAKPTPRARARSWPGNPASSYAQASLEDLSGSIEMLVFPEAYRKLQEKVKIEVPVLIRGGVRIEEGANPKLTVNDISSLEEGKVPLPRALRIRVPLEKASESTIDELHLLFSQRKGEARVLFDVERESDFMVVMEAEGYNVLPDRLFVSRVEEVCGRGSVRVID